MPADYTVVAGYLGWIHAQGTVAPGSLSTYPAPIDTVHELAGYPAPTGNPIFCRLRKGYLRLDAARAGGMPKSEGRTESRAAFRIPVYPLGCKYDPVLRFLAAYRADFLAAGGRLFAPLFAPPGTTLGPRSTSRWLRLALSCLGVKPPIGTRWRGKSIRSGAATAANSVGVPLPVVAAYMEHKDTATTARHYVDARALPTDAAWDFFGRYISDWSGKPGPVRRKGYA
ncbi:hypothetical protein I4F81_002683 [Pyropia yezoensis]|uniref:Uncharacterized protein n=1 Tax=Pyropia yezoensis TaxID=2788 RepID=A0ACC3BQA0_PYRYE|nr:hypothetical protein I4F81_002683 [Neopyropia yezoensis]